MVRLIRRGEVAEVSDLTADENLALCRAFGRYGRAEDRAMDADVVRRYEHSGAGHWFLRDCLGNASLTLVPITEDRLR